MCCFSPLAPFPLHMDSWRTIEEEEGRKEMFLFLSPLSLSPVNVARLGGFFFAEPDLKHPVMITVSYATEPSWEVSVLPQGRWGMWVHLWIPVPVSHKETFLYFDIVLLVFFFPGHIISFSFLETTETLAPTLTCHSSPVMCWRPFGAAYLQRKSVFPVLLGDFHHFIFNLGKNPPSPKQAHVQEPRQTGLYWKEKTQTVPSTTKPTKLKSISILTAFKHLDSLYSLKKM